MNDHEKISALIDGELGQQEAEQMLDRLQHEPALAEVWRRYQLQRAALRHEAGDAVDLSAAVMRALDEEPLAPVVALAAANDPVWWRRAWVRAAGGMTLAAGLALGMVSVWQTATPVEDASNWQALYAAAELPHVLVTPADEDGSVLEAGLDDQQRESAYLLAHAEYAGRGLQANALSMTRMADLAEVD